MSTLSLQTHMQAIAALVAAGKVKCVCSQNVDCLHLRSGIDRAVLCELHGNCFAERCEACK
jgi:mono-ADP-ribosyltransferase sirtuin 6